jgi:hypothetical protein
MLTNGSSQHGRLCAALIHGTASSGAHTSRCLAGSGRIPAATWGISESVACMRRGSAGSAFAELAERPHPSVFIRFLPNSCNASRCFVEVCLVRVERALICFIHAHYEP